MSGRKRRSYMLRNDLVEWLDELEENDELTRTDIVKEAIRVFYESDIDLIKETAQRLGIARGKLIDMLIFQLSRMSDKEVRELASDYFAQSIIESRK